MGGALCAVFAMSELLKPRLGELAAEAMEAKDKLGTSLMVGASVACIGLGALGGVIAMGAANAPHDAYDALVKSRDAAQTRLDQAQRRVDAVPTCTPDMPKVRCEAQTLQNVATQNDRTQTRNEARSDLDAAKAMLARAHNPGPGLHVEIWQKALVIAAVEFVLFAVPFAARRTGTVRIVTEVAEGAAKSAAKGEALKVNDGGWKRRRQLYGPTGRKAKVRYSAPLPI
jgi:hypothetical protein